MRALLLCGLLAFGVVAGCLGDDSLSTPEPTTTPAPAPPRDDRPADAALSQSGRWLAPFEGQVPAVSMALLNDGRILYWTGVEANEGDGITDWDFFTQHPLIGESRIVDLSGAEPFVTTPQPPDGGAADLFCAGLAIMPDGRVLAVGGSEWREFPRNAPPFFLDGSRDTRYFDPKTDTWTVGPDMLLGRWYPTLLELPDGSPLAASGIGNLPTPDDLWTKWETYNQTEGQWNMVPGIDQRLPMYARLWVVGGGPYKGLVFYNTAGTLWGPFGEHPTELEWFFQYAFNLTTGEKERLGLSVFGARQYAVSVPQILEPERDYAPYYVTFGGTIAQTLVTTPFTETNDLATSPPTNTIADMMNYPRWNHQGILLPDGAILAIGGGLYDNVIAHGMPNIPILSAERWDPGDHSWTELAAMTVPRMYHSTAVLLPDGRVLTGGHVPLPNPFPTVRDTVNPQIVETRLEIFEPPYLFRGPRPAILAGPESTTYGESFTLTIDHTAPLESVVLMHPGALTHAWDSGQRGVRLEIVGENGNQVTVRAPPDAVVAAPGDWMLFANQENADGAVPSVAHWLHLS